MKIIKVRIKNYKSITDSGDCYLENGITIFAGKNEAGKTSILEAIEDFNLSKNIRPEAKHLFKKDAIPSIEITFLIGKKDIKKITEETGFEPIDKEQEREITIIKTFPNEYKVEENTFRLLYGSSKEENIQKAQKILESLQSLIADDNPVISLNLQNPNDTLNKLTALENNLLKDEASTKLAGQVIESKELLQKIIKLQETENKLVEVIKKLIPNFILFNSFEETFPSEIPFEEIATNPIMKDLSEISGLNLETIKNGLPHEKTTHKEELNIKVKEDYKRFWSQDFTNLHFEWENGKLNFFIKEDGKYYPPKIRSQGKRWHLAFYIRVTARNKEDVDNVILIDEPGLFLHSSAQKDILKKLAEISKKNTVIFSTHSPYLLDPNEFERIRLVIRGKIPVVVDANQVDPTEKLAKYYEEKRHKKAGEKYYKLKKSVEKLDEEETDQIRKILSNSNYNVGTKIEQKIHKVADMETLRPLLTAIGLELSSGIVNLDKKNNVVCEGQSDVYYMQALCLNLNEENLNFVFGGGAPNMPYVGTILNGWGCNVVYLYDNDSGFQNAKKKLEDDWLLTVDDIVKVLKESNAIEDIFSKDDFIKLVLDDEKAEIKTSNSAYVSDKDKILLSKKFLAKIKTKKIALSDETKQNFQSVVSEILNKFEKLN